MLFSLKNQLKVCFTGNFLFVVIIIQYIHCTITKYILLISFLFPLLFSSLILKMSLRERFWSCPK